MNDQKTSYYAAHRETVLAKSAARYAANPEKYRARTAAWKAAHPERQRAYSAAYDAAHREKVRARVSAWSAAHPEKAAAWRAANPEKFRAYEANRRAMKLKQRCTCCTSDHIEEFFLQTALYGGEVDHVIPLALGGRHCRHNLQAMTYEEHREKTTLDQRAIAEARRRSKLLRDWPVLKEAA